jgi:hypothetical protein
MSKCNEESWCFYSSYNFWDPEKIYIKTGQVMNQDYDIFIDDPRYMQEKHEEFWKNVYWANLRAKEKWNSQNDYLCAIIPHYYYEEDWG